jgi:DNA-directed RNA polymerase subunit beta'
VEFRDMIPGVTVKRELDERRAHRHRRHRAQGGPAPADRHRDPTPRRSSLATYSIPAGAHVVVNEGDKSPAGSLLAKTPRKASKTKDITGGLPRVAELFEARRPKDAPRSPDRRHRRVRRHVRGKRKLIVREETGEEEEHLIPHGKHIIVSRRP